MNSTTVGSCCCVWAVTRGVRGCPLLPALIDGTREMATNIYTAQAAARPRNKVARIYMLVNSRGGEYSAFTSALAQSWWWSMIIFCATNGPMDGPMWPAPFLGEVFTLDYRTVRVVVL